MYVCMYVCMYVINDTNGQDGIDKPFITKKAYWSAQFFTLMALIKDKNFIQKTEYNLTLHNLQMQALR